MAVGEIRVEDLLQRGAIFLSSASFIPSSALRTSLSPELAANAG